MKFLITVWPLPSHYCPLIAIAHALREAGHDVAFYTGTSAHRVIAGEGFGCFPFRAVDEAKFDQLMAERGESASGRHPLRMKALLRRWLLGTLPQQVDDLTALLDLWQPDTILAETSLWGPMLVLWETRGIPVAVFSTVVGCMLPGPDAPPFGPGLPPPRTWPARWLACLARAAGDLLAADFREAANELRGCYGLRPLRISVTEFLGQMPLYLMPSVPEFDYQRRDLPDSVHYVGPCLWDKPRGEPAPAWLAQLAHNQPWVHVTEGTVHVQRPLLLRAAAQGLAGLPAHVIMTTGGNRDLAHLDLGPIAPNVQVARWVAHSDLLPYTDVLITTGGAGTVMAALTAGVPLVVVPTEWDKPENAQRVVEAGVGLRIAPRDCTPARLRAAVERVLEDPTFRRNAQRLRTILTHYGGPTRAAQLLGQLAGGQLAGRPVEDVIMC